MPNVFNPNKLIQNDLLKTANNQRKGQTALSSNTQKSTVNPLQLAWNTPKAAKQTATVTDYGNDSLNEKYRSTVKMLYNLQEKTGSSFNVIDDAKGLMNAYIGTVKASYGLNSGRSAGEYLKIGQNEFDRQLQDTIFKYQHANDTPEQMETFLNNKGYLGVKGTQAKNAQNVIGAAKALGAGNSQQERDAAAYYDMLADSTHINDREPKGISAARQNQAVMGTGEENRKTGISADERDMQRAKAADLWQSVRDKEDVTLEEAEQFLAGQGDAYTFAKAHPGDLTGWMDAFSRAGDIVNRAMINGVDKLNATDKEVYYYLQGNNGPELGAGLLGMGNMTNQELAGYNAWGRQKAQELAAANGLYTQEQLDPETRFVRDQWRQTPDGARQWALDAVGTEEEQEAKQNEWFVTKRAKFDEVPTVGNYAEDSKPQADFSSGDATLDRYYRIINNIGGARDSADLYQSMSGGNDPALTFFYNTDETDQGKFTALMNRGEFDEARDYLDYMQYAVNEKTRERTETAMYNLGNSGALGAIAASALSVPLSLTRGVGALDIGLQNLRNQFGEYRPVDYNRMQAMGAGADAARQGVQDQVNWEMNVLGQDVDLFDFLYGTAMSGVDSLAAGALGSWAGPAVLGLGAAQNTMMDLQQQGGNDRQVMVGGALAGAFETLFEHISIGQFYDEAKHLGKRNFGEHMKNILAQAGINFSEEFNTELFDMIAEESVMGSKAQTVKQRQEYIDLGLTEQEADARIAQEKALRLLEAGFGGALMGGAFGGISNISSDVNTSRYETKAGKIFDAESKDTLKSLGSSMPDGEAKGLARKYDPEKATDRETGALVRAIMQELPQQAQGNFRESFVMGMLNSLEDMSPDAAEAIADMMSGRQLAPEQIDALAKDQAGMRAVYDLLGVNGETGRAMQKRQTETAQAETAPALEELAPMPGTREPVTIKAPERADRAQNAGKGTITVGEKQNEAEWQGNGLAGNVRPSEQSQEARRNVEPVEKVAGDDMLKAPKEPILYTGKDQGPRRNVEPVEAVAGDDMLKAADNTETQSEGTETTGKAAPLEKRQGIMGFSVEKESGGAVARMEDGSEQDVDSLDIPDAQKALAQEAADLPAEAQGVILRNYEGQDAVDYAQRYAKGMKTVYNAAKNGRTLEDTRSLYAEDLNDEQRKAAWEAGRAAYQQEEQKAQADTRRMADKVKADGYNFKVLEQEDAEQQHKGVYLARVRNAMTRNQEIQLAVLEDVLNKKGIPVQIRVYDTLGDKNGSYQAGSNIVNVALDAEGGLINRTVSHELYHFVKEWNQEAAGKLQSFVIDTLNGTETFDLDKRRQDIARQYRDRAGQELKPDAIDEEIAAESMLDAFDTQENLQAFYKNADKSLIEKITDWIKDTVAKIRDAMARIGRNHPEVEAMRGNLAALEKVQADLIAAAQTAGRNYQEARAGMNSQAAQDADVMAYQEEMGKAVTMDAAQEARNGLESALFARYYADLGGDLGGLEYEDAFQRFQAAMEVFGSGESRSLAWAFNQAKIPVPKQGMNSVLSYAARQMAAGAREAASVKNEGKKYSFKADDAAYMDAAERGDEEEAQRMVDEAAKAAGAATDSRGKLIKLYHGTKRFGFTTFRDGPIFTTTNRSVAAGYSDFGQDRTSSQKARRDGTAQGLINDIKATSNWQIHALSEGEARSIRAGMADKSRAMNDLINAAYDQNTDYMPPNEIANDFYEVTGAFGSILDNVDALENREGAAREEYARAMGLDFDYLAAYERLREYYNEHKAEIERAGGKPFFDAMFKGYEYGDALTELEYRFKRALNPADQFVNRNGSIMTRAEIEGIIDQDDAKGNYTGYGFLGDNPLTVDAGGAYWLNIKNPAQGSGVYSTDSIVKWAQENGYSAVVIKNVMDPGVVNATGDDYIFFNSNQFKESAPITYDDAGNVIPLSERFNQEEKDIRYSFKAEEADTSEESEALRKNAVSIFGKTYNWNVTGYVLPDGTRLDFSGKREGSSGQYREEDHRNIKDAYGEDTELSGTEAMIDFMRRGAIRIMPESGGIQLQTIPTRQQLQALDGFISKMHGEVIIDIDDQNGKTIYSKEYDRGTFSRRIIGDIPSLFEEAQRSQSDTARFHEGRYSFKADEEADTERQALEDVREDADLYAQAISDEFTMQAIDDFAQIYQAIERVARNMSGDGAQEGNWKKRTYEIANRLKTETGSTMSTKEVAKWISRVFQAIDRGGYVSGEVLMYARDLGMELLKKAPGMEIPMDETTKEIRRIVKERGFYLTDEMKSEITGTMGSVEDFRRKNFGKMRIVKQGASTPSLAEVWMEDLNRLNPGVFAADVAEADMPDILDRWLETSGEKKYTGEFGTNATHYATSIALELMMDYLDAPWSNTRIKNLTARYDRNVKKVRTEYQSKYEERVNKAREQKEVRERKDKIIANIKGNARYINTRVMNPKNTRHIPEEYRGAAEAFVYNLYGDRAIFSADEAKEYAMKYAKWASDEKLHEIGGISPQIQEELGWLAQNVTEDTPLRTMTEEQLNKVDHIVGNFRKIIDDGNTVFMNGKQQDMDTLVGNEMAALSRREDAKNGTLREASRKFFTKELTPIYYAMRVGGVVESGIREFIEKQSDYIFKDKAAKAFYEEAVRLSNVNGWLYDKPLEMTTRQGDKIILNKNQAMSLYAWWKRETTNSTQSAEHLRLGGFTYDTSDKDTRNLKGVNLYKPHIMMQEDFEQISNYLSQVERDFADKLVGYLSKDVAAWCNEMSMRMYGYNQFEEKYYFPYPTDPQYRSKGLTQEQRQKQRLYNWGGAKPLTEYARNPLKLQNFTDLWLKHVNEAAMYSTYAEAIQNLDRVTNYVYDGESMYDDQGNLHVTPPTSLKKRMEQAYGREAVQYLETLLDDLNGGVRNDDRTGWDKAVTLFKKGSVAANLSVVLQQPSAFVRAMSMVNPKYFAKALTPSSLKGVKARMYENSGAANIKDMGRFDTNVGKSAEEWMGEAIKPESRGERIYNGMDKWTGMGAELADEITWCYMYAAVENEIADNTDLERNTEAFNEAAGKRFDEVMTQTQVYDSTLAKSEYMRATGTYTKMLTSFMGEPTLTANMLINAAWDVMEKKPGAKKAAAVTTGVFISTAMLNALLKSFATAFRRTKDEDKGRTYWEKYLAEAAGNVADDVNPFGIAGMLPVARDIVSIVQGYDVERADMSIAADLFKYLTKAMKADSSAEDWLNLAGAAGNLFGIPARNVIRDVGGIWKTFFGGAAAKDPTSEKALLYSVLDNIKIGPWSVRDSSRAAYYDRMEEALKAGDMEKYNELRGYVEDTLQVKADTVTSGIKGEIKKSFTSGLISDDKAIELLEALGMDGKKAFDAVNKWQQTAGHEDEEDFEYNKYGNLQSMIAAGQDISAEVKRFTDHGTSEKTMESAVKGAIKDLYTAGSLTDSQAESSIKKYLGITDKDEIHWLMDEWAYKRDNGAEASYSKYVDVFDAVKNGTSLTAAMKEMTQNGYTEKDVRGQIKSKISEWYKKGELTKAQTESKLKQYAGITDSNDLYWAMDQLDYEKKNPKGEYRKYNEFYKAVETGSSLQATVKRYLDHGVKKDTMAGQITSQYKAQYVELYKKDKTKAAELKARLLTAYAALGYDRNKKNKDIDKWLK